MNLRNNLRKKERKLMPKFKLLVDVDSVVDEAEHLEEIFKDGFDCSE